MTLELEIDVPESRQVTLTLPPEVPVGKAKLTVQPQTGVPPPPPGLSEKALRERVAFYRLLPQLLNTHRGQVVAIHNERVIAVGDDRRTVIDAARKIAQGLGARLDHLASLIAVSGATARLLNVGERQAGGREVWRKN